MRCGACGEKIEVTDSLVDGQHVICPFCNEKTAYSKPTRVELPVVADVEKKVKPKLAIRRPQVMNSGTAGSESVVNAVESRFRDQKRKERARKVKQFCGNLFSIIFLILILLGGYKLWQAYKEDRLKDFAEKLSRNYGEITKGCLEGENASVVKKEDGTQKENSRDNSQLSSNVAKEDDKRRREYEHLIAGFRGSSLFFWRHLDKSKRPGCVDGIFVVAIPAGKKNFHCYEVVSAQTGITNIVRHSVNAAPTTIALPDFKNRLSANGGIVLANGASYMFRPKSVQMTFQAPQQGGEFDPAGEYMGALRDVASMLGVNANDISYEVSFLFSDVMNPVVVGIARHGKCIPYETFKNSVRPIVEDVHRKSMPSEPKMKKYKRTIVFHAGSLVSKGLGGITKVPREWPGNRSIAYSEWLRLRDEALRQEGEAQRISRENTIKHEEWKRRVNSPPDSSLVQKILYAGKVSIKPKAGGER